MYIFIWLAVETSTTSMAPSMGFYVADTAFDLGRHRRVVTTAAGMPCWRYLKVILARHFLTHSSVTPSRKVGRPGQFSLGVQPKHWAEKRLGPAPLAPSHFSGQFWADFLAKSGPDEPLC